MNNQIAVVMPVLINHAWQMPMTQCALQTLRCTTDVPIKIVVTEAVKSGRDSMGVPYSDGPNDADAWIMGPYTGNPTKDINDGIDEAVKRWSPEYILYMGNDTFVRPGWAEALLECFQRADCGIATLSSADLGHTPIGQVAGQNVIHEGLYGPFMMFRSGWRFDHETFPCAFADSDLMMRVYEMGQRSFRHNRVVIQHLNRQTLEAKNDEVQLSYEESQVRFNTKWGHSPLLIRRMLTDGWII